MYGFFFKQITPSFEQNNIETVSKINNNMNNVIIKGKDRCKVSNTNRVVYKLNAKIDLLHMQDE